MTVTHGDPLYRDPALARFYDLDNSPRADFAACIARAVSAERILDLGCGTGSLLAAMAAKYPHKSFTGVDPAQAMLDIAQQKSDRVRWICCTAEALRLSAAFDLIILSGHAFQVFLTQEQRIAVLQTLCQHLSPDGVVLFDSRNPQKEEWREWTPDLSRETFRHHTEGDVTVWNDVEEHAGFIRYFTHYQTGDAGSVISAASDIAFPSYDEICDAVRSGGLAIRHLYGDWQLKPFTASSPEMVFELVHPGKTESCAA